MAANHCHVSRQIADHAERESRDMEREAAIEQMAAELAPPMVERKLASGDWISTALYAAKHEQPIDQLLAEAVAGTIRPVTLLRIKWLARQLAKNEAAVEAWKQAEREIDGRDPLDDLNF